MENQQQAGSAALPIPGMKKNININELFFDLVIGLLAPVLARTWIRNDTGIPSCPWIYFLVLYALMPFYFSVLLHQYRSIAERSRAVFVLFAAAGTFTVFTFFYSLFMDSVPMMNRLGIIQGDHLGWYLAGLFCIFFGILSGAIDFLGDRRRGPSVAHMVIIVVTIVVTVIFSLFTVIKNSDHPQRTWAIGVFLFLGGLALVAVIVNGVYRAGMILADWTERKGNLHGWRRVVTDFLLPLAVSSILVIWEEITLLQAGPRVMPGAGKVLYLLVFGGILPIRLLMALSPPFRSVNALIAVLAFVVHLFYLGNPE